MENLARPDKQGVIIVGTGGFAIELEGLLEDASMSVLGFIGPRAVRQLPQKWLGDDHVLSHMPRGTRVLIAIGSPEIRQRVNRLVARHGLDLRSYVHSSAYVSQRSYLGRGCIIYPNATVHAQVTLDECVLVNSNVTIGHETRVSAFANLGPAVAVGGCCKIGARAYLGIGSTLVENIEVLPDCVIGAGAVLIDDTETLGTYVGIPARKTKG